MEEQQNFLIDVVGLFGQRDENISIIGNKDLDRTLQGMIPNMLTVVIKALNCTTAKKRTLNNLL